jgi:predicted permease
MGTLTQDIRYGLRMLRKNAGMTLIAILTLALGIGANTTIFSAVNGILLRPLPVAHADQLVVIGGQQQGGDTFSRFSYADFADIRSQSGAFSDVMAYNLSLAGMESEGRTEPVVFSYVSGNFFSGLGLQAAAGRLFYGAESEKLGTENVVVLGYGYWKKRFSSDPSIVGRQVKLNGHLFTVAGIAPESFHGPYSLVDMQAYIPLGTRILWQTNTDKTDDPKDYWTRRDFHDLAVLAIVKPGVTRTQAEVASNVVADRLNRQYPDSHKGLALHLYPERIARPDPDPSNGIVIVGAVFMVLAGLVLLLACFNVANIVLVRATTREREMAVRTALGAARTRIVRQLLTESILLAMLGGAVGLLAGIWASRLLSSIRIEIATIPLRFDFSFDWRVFVFGLAAALLTGLVVGLSPAWRAARRDFNQVLHEGSRGVLGSGRSRLRSALVTAQVAGSLILLVVAGLFVRSAQNTEHTYLGFDPHHVLNATMETRTVGYDLPRTKELFRDVEDRVEALPGVESVSIASSIPMGYSFSGKSVYVEGRPAASKEAVPFVYYNVVDPPYFANLRVPLLRGRTFTEQDKDDTPLVAVINEAMAKKFWPDQDPLGKRFSAKDASGPFIQIVGLMKQGKYNDPVDDTVPFYYIPQAQAMTTFVTLQIRTAGAPEALVPDVERTIHDLAPGMPLTDVQSMEDSLGGVNGYFLSRLGSRFSVALGLIGLLLALVGLYGVISYVAAQRTHEIGVRMALGADRNDILKLVLRQGIRLVGGGVLVGLVLTFIAARGMSSLLVGVSPSDPLTLGVVSILLAFVGVIASLIPARRAMKVEPLRALKYE